MSDKQKAINYALQNLYKSKGSIHVADSGHDVSGKRECWCKPEVRFVDGITDRAVIIHQTKQ